MLPMIVCWSQDVMQAMRSHYEDTALDMAGRVFPDVGAGPQPDSLFSNCLNETL